MIQKKICLLGAPGVGKTSLVRQFVHSIFSEEYLSTLGVNIEKKTVTVGEEEVHLVVWDVAGEEYDFELPMTYVRGAAGYLLVADGTREDTLGTAMGIRKRIEGLFGRTPHVVLLNKADLEEEWVVDEDALAPYPWPILRTSAKTGAHVEEAFQTLAEAMLKA